MKRAARFAGMGTFTWPVRVAPMGGGPSQEIEASVDTGAAYTTLPARFLHELGVEPMTRRRFLVADGRMADMDIGRAWVTVDGVGEVTIVAFGEDHAPPLLGAYTMEGLGLEVDPTTGRLGPARLIMDSLSTPSIAARRLRSLWRRADRRLRAAG